MGSREASSHAKEEGEDVEAATALNCGMSLGEGICSVGENFDPLLVGRLTITKQSRAPNMSSSIHEAPPLQALNCLEAAISSLYVGLTMP
ncbi:unnamed protein product [Sphagnum troendelagicum]